MNPHPIMIQNSIFRCLLMLLMAIFGSFLPATAKVQATDEGVLLRFVCLASLVEDQELVLASRDDDAKWRELGTVSLRSPIISEWMPAKVGELHLAVKEEAALKSICHFTFPAGTRSALIVLRPNEAKDAYEAHVVDHKKTGFVKGSTLIVNFSQHAALVKMGSDEHTIQAEQELVVKPVLDENRMYRLAVSRLDDEGKTVLCYDRSASGNPDSREMVFLLPHKSRGIRVLSLPLFDSID